MRGQVSTVTAQRAAAEVWGLQVDAEPLPGEFDANFRLDLPDGSHFILKFHHPDWRDADLDLQNRALERSGSRLGGGGVPRIVPTRDGEEVPVWTEEVDAPVRLRLLTWLEGIFLAEVRPLERELLEDVGRFLGRLDGALAGLEHPAMERPLLWDMARAPVILRRHLPAVAPGDRRSRLERILEGFEDLTRPRLEGLPRSLIHNDANDYNVLIGPDRRCSGLIDFGDMLHTWTICEPAIAAAYAMLDESDLVAVAAAVVGGYHATRPLQEGERRVFFDLVRMRLAVSVAVSARRRQEEPDDPYLTISEAPAWRTLERLDGLDPDAFTGRIHAACPDGNGQTERGETIR